MKITRLSLASIVGCLIGLIAIALIGGVLVHQVKARQAEMASLMALQDRVDYFSALSDGLLVQWAAPSEWQAYLADAAALQQALSRREAEYSSASRAIQRIDGIVEILKGVYGEDRIRTNLGYDEGAIALSLADRILVNQVAGQGIALDAALGDMAGHQRSAITQKVNWTFGAFAIATLLFAGYCIVSFTLLFRRIHGPLRSLTDVAARVEQGQYESRATLQGNDELSELAHTLNRMLDRQDEDKQHILARARLLEMAGKLAQFGGWWFDVVNNRVHWSDMVTEIHGMPPDYSPSLEDSISFYAPEHRQRIRDCFSACVESGTPYDVELQIINAEGQHLWVRTTGVQVRDDQGRVVRVEGAFQDITRQHETTERLENALNTRRALFNSLPAHIALIDAEGRVADVNERWRHFGVQNGFRDEKTGVGSDYLAICREAAGEHTEGALEVEAGLRSLLQGEQTRFQVDYPCHSPLEQRWFRLMASRIEGFGETNERLGAVVMHIDITEHRRTLQRLEELAFKDTLTGLWNRKGFTAAVGQHLEEQGWLARHMVVVMDIKGLSNINDAHGYHVGDRLLGQVGHRLAEWLGHDRLGCTNGDSFLLFLRVKGTGRPEAQWRWLASSLEAPFFIDGVPIEVAARLGIAPLGEQERSVDQLIHEAEAALFNVRTRGIRDWGLYTPELDEAIRERLALSHDMARALEEDQFELHYQPKVNLQTGDLIACEALLRWLHPERGMLSPGIFIPVAEQSQLIGPIGEWVLLEACRQLRAWQDDQLEVVRVAVNVSVVQFELGGLVDQVRHAITTHGIAPGSLIIEITENVYAHQSSSLLQQIHELHELGVQLSLDDFGTGYSSLRYLQDYPFDEIKIDMAFVRRIAEDPYSHRIVSTILGISQVLGAQSVAEGIESPEVRDILIDMGCEVGQGFYFSMPLAAEDFRWLLEKRSPLPLPAPSPSPDPVPSNRRCDETSGK